MVRLLVVLLLAAAPLAGASIAAGPAPTDWAALTRRYSEVLVQTPDDADARFTLGVIQAHEGRLVKGWENLKRADRLLGGDRGRPAFARRTIAAARQAPEGIAWWERGLRSDPKNAVLHYMLGLAYSRKGDMKKAAGHFAAAYRDRTLYEYITGRRRA